MPENLTWIDYKEIIDSKDLLLHNKIIDQRRDVHH